MLHGGKQYTYQTPVGFSSAIAAPGSTNDPIGSKGSKVSRGAVPPWDPRGMPAGLAGSRQGA